MNFQHTYFLHSVYHRGIDLRAHTYYSLLICKHTYCKSTCINRSSRFLSTINISVHDKKPYQCCICIALYLHCMSKFTHFMPNRSCEFICSVNKACYMLLHVEYVIHTLTSILFLVVYSVSKVSSSLSINK